MGISGVEGLFRCARPLRGDGVPLLGLVLLGCQFWWWNAAGHRLGPWTLAWDGGWGCVQVRQERKQKSKPRRVTEVMYFHFKGKYTTFVFHAWGEVIEIWSFLKKS